MLFSVNPKCCGQSMKRVGNSKVQERYFDPFTQKERYKKVRYDNYQCMKCGKTQKVRK